MKKWISKRSNQAIVFLTCTQLLLVVNSIIPTHEEITYYSKKIDTLKKQVIKLDKYALHIDRHEKDLPNVLEKLNGLKNRIQQVQDIRLLQNNLGKLQRNSKLKVITQELHKSKAKDQIEKTVVKLTLEGKYGDQMNFIQNLKSLNEFLILAECSFRNTSPNLDNPVIQMELELNAFYYVSDEN